MAESRKPTMAWNPRAGRWEFWVRDKSGPIVTIDGNGLSVARGSLSYNQLTVGSLLSGNTLNIGGIGSIADARVQRLILGGGTISLLKKFTGTIALTAVGTGSVAVATISGQGSAGIAVGDLVFGNPKAALSGVGIAGFYVPTTNVVNVYISNPNSQGGGSLPATGIDIYVQRST